MTDKHAEVLGNRVVTSTLRGELKFHFPWCVTLAQNGVVLPNGPRISCGDFSTAHYPTFLKIEAPVSCMRLLGVRFVIGTIKVYVERQTDSSFSQPDQKLRREVHASIPVR
jgi:hypothetical protein